MLLEKTVDLRSVGAVFETLISRLADEKFVASLTEDPRGTLETAGLLLDKEAVEEFITASPERFNELSDAMLQALNGDLLSGLGAIASTCSLAC